ncbi:MAG: radical SAM protein [Deltaproteobacteria bacterium]|nr:radical SAM protein [Deltaproteobacteria bacterium]
MAANTNITDEDRRAATNVTVSGSGHRFEIQLGHLCNNRCVFCSSGQMTAMKIARPVPIEPIIEALEEARAAGATHLTFLGGEPTIHKHFLTALKRAVELGFEHIVIFTNGVMFPHPGFIDSVTDVGNFEWRISIQGATEEAHVATTERPQSFQRILHGLRILHDRGQLITANMCVNERSYRSLPHYPELVERYGVNQLHVDIVRPESTGERNEDYLRDIMPRYADMAPYYSEMLAGFDRWNPDFDINVGNLPYCVLPQWAFRVHHGGQQTVTKSSDASGLEDEMNKYEWQTSLRTHLPSCAECVFRSRCTGIFRVYLELHGGDEFKPVSREQLLALDPERRSFVVLSEPLLIPLRNAIGAGQLPAPWRLLHEVTEDRLRFIEIHLAHSEGGIRLKFVRPGSGQAPVISTPEYDVEADADLSVAAGALDVLFRWLQSHLVTALDAASRCALATDAIDRAQRRSVLQRGRQRVALHAERLQSRFAFPGWHIEPLRWPSESTAEMVARGARGGRVDVRFTLSNRSGRSQVGVDFQPDKSSDPATVKPVIAELVSVLRGAQTAGNPTSGADAVLAS